MRVGATAIAAVLVALAAAGCGSSSSAKPKILDTERVERAIEQSILQKRGIHAMVSCPSGIERKKGTKFRCSASYKGRITPFLVTEDDDKGSVHYVGLKG